VKSVRGATLDEVKRILVVDDDRVAAAVVVAAVRDLPWTPFVCADAEAAYRLATTERWDLVLMDLELGEASGADVTRRLRDHEASSGGARTPVVALTGHRDGDVLRDALAAGCDGILVKPVPVPLLRQALARFARLATPPPRPALASLDDLAVQFLKDLGVPVSALRAAVLAGSLAEARHIGHRLAGTAGTLGFAGIGDAARRVEVAASAGDLEGARAAADDLVAAHTRALR